MTYFKREAHACRIYGMIKQTEGQVGVTDLSRRLGIDIRVVSDIVRERKWKVLNRRAETIHAHNARRGEPQELSF